jgi:hypothetical protein
LHGFDYQGRLSERLDLRQRCTQFQSEIGERKYCGKREPDKQNRVSQEQTSYFAHATTP